MSKILIFLSAVVAIQTKRRPEQLAYYDKEIVKTSLCPGTLHVLRIRMIESQCCNLKQVHKIDYDYSN